MRLILRTNAKNLYCVHLPNHLDLDNTENILNQAIEKLPTGTKYKSHYINSDDLCDEERKQLDYYGKVKYPTVLLSVNIYEKEAH